MGLYGRKLDFQFKTHHQKSYYQTTDLRFVQRVFQNDSVIYSKIRFSSSKRDAYELDMCL